MSWAMPSHTLHVVQAFEQRDGGIVPVEPKACPSAGSARALAARLAPTTSASSPGHERAILNSATGIPPGPGIIPDGGRRRGSAISPCPSARVAVRAKRQAAPPKCSPCR